MIRDDDAGLYVISVAAELAGVHPQTLRLYERKGLLDPARSAGGNRRYSERDLARLRQIGELTAAGVNLEGVRRILELEDEVAELRAELDRTRADAAQALADTHRQYRRELVPYRAALVPWRTWNRPVANATTPETTTDREGDGSARRLLSHRR
jgi:MerR family transcriptional regulator/heat shock protein HspR